MNIDMFPLVSVIIVNYNGKGFLLDCLGAVFKSRYKNIEVIVVDNGSTDGSLAAVKSIFSDERLRCCICLDTNFGPAYARNRGIEASNGIYIAFLDNDTLPMPEWLEKPVELMQEDLRVAFCQCKLLLRDAHDKLDYVGDYLGQFGFLIQRAHTAETDTGQYDSQDDIFSAKSAAMVARASILKRVGYFDEDYFIYLEETDLCWRGWLLGKKTVFIPESRVVHAFGGSALSLGDKQNYFAKFHGCKNYITTLIKNLGVVSIIKIVPVHLMLWVCICFWLILHGRIQDARYTFRGILWVFKNMPSILKKRKEIQSKRVMVDEDLFKIIMRKKGLSYFYRKLSKARAVGYAQGFYSHKN